MNREIIFIVVIMVFAFIVGKYKLLPYFAAKKILKDAKNDKQDNGNATTAPFMPHQMPYTVPYGGYPITLAQQPPEPHKRHDIGFDYAVIEYTVDGKMPECGYIFDCYKVGEMFGRLNKGGCCLDTFDIVNLGDGLAIAYVTYHM